jgi:NAD(P)-dependent dehydrogenase (short-subunit alcohol dehydrogenase family)
MSKQAVAVVTGAAGDIGQAIAVALAPNYTIAVVDINATQAEVVAERLRMQGHAAQAFVYDLTSNADITKLSNDISSLGQVKVLVNNAGAAFSESFQSASAESIRRDIALNLEAPLQCVKAFEQDLKQQGIVVNIASVNGLHTFGHPVYSAAKAGVIQFTKTLAVEYGKFGLRANVIAPGTVKTQAWNARAEANPEVLADSARLHPLGRIATPEDIAATVLFLCSDTSAAISGVCLPVDCGLTAGQPTIAQNFSQSDDYAPK